MTLPADDYQSYLADCFSLRKVPMRFEDWKEEVRRAKAQADWIERAYVAMTLLFPTN